MEPYSIIPARYVLLIVEQISLCMLNAFEPMTHDTKKIRKILNTPPPVTERTPKCTESTPAYTEKL